MDANADTTDSGFADFLIACSLHDLHTDGDVDPPPETYYRGKKKIDFCLGTNGVAHAVTCAVGSTPLEVNNSSLFMSTNNARWSLYFRPPSYEVIPARVTA